MQEQGSLSRHRSNRYASEPPDHERNNASQCQTTEEILELNHNSSESELKPYKQKALEAVPDLAMASFPCYIPGCNARFILLSNLRRHQRTVHAGGQSTCYRCSVPGCKKPDKVWNRVDNFRKHLWWCHPFLLGKHDEVDVLIRSAKNGSENGETVFVNEFMNESPSSGVPREISSGKDTHTHWAHDSAAEALSFPVPQAPIIHNEIDVLSGDQLSTIDLEVTELVQQASFSIADADIMEPFLIDPSWSWIHTSLSEFQG